MLPQLINRYSRSVPPAPAPGTPRKLGSRQSPAEQRPPPPSVSKLTLVGKSCCWLLPLPPAYCGDATDDRQAGPPPVLSAQPAIICRTLYACPVPPDPNATSYCE